MGLAAGTSVAFAHRTFNWSNEAKGKAAVHCVIVGFGLNDRAGKVIYEYDDIKGEPTPCPRTSTRIWSMPPTPCCPNQSPHLYGAAHDEGSALIDNGHLFLSPAEAED